MAGPPRLLLDEPAGPAHNAAMDVGGPQGRAGGAGVFHMIDDGEAPATGFRDPLTGRIVDFLRRIGLTVHAGAIPEPTVLPGIKVDHGALVVDEARLKFPGDLLHEAGHLAVVNPARRAAMHRDVGNNGAEEMCAIAWSYAAALHLGINPALVFHAEGYRGGGASILENFAQKRTFGVPMLQWAGMTFEDKQARQHGVAAFPHMRRWLRDQ